jgi:hypothetical protein
LARSPPVALHALPVGSLGVALGLGLVVRAQELAHGERAGVHNRGFLLVCRLDVTNNFCVEKSESHRLQKH